MFEYAPSILTLMVFIGSATSFFAATTGVVQNDIKKIIAYSTCSQLGYMVFACGFSGYSAALFHLVNHAFFKALLFLAAGSVIHGLSNEQDIRRMGGLAKIMPLTYVMFLIGSLSLIGFPFLSGFYSKDLILEIAYSKYTLNSRFVYWLGTITASLTSLYSFRLIYFVFFGRTNVINRTVLNNIHDAPFGMAFPMLLLCLGSIFSGYFFKDVFVGIGTDFFKHTILVRDVNTTLVGAEFLPTGVKLIPTGFSLFGLVLSLFFCSNKKKQDLLFFNSSGYKGVQLRIFRLSFSFLSNKWYFDLVYFYFILLPFLKTAYYFCFQFIDQYFLKFFGPVGVSSVVYRTSISLVKSQQSGLITNYAFYMCYFLLVILTVV